MARVQVASEVRGLLTTIRGRLRGRDTALIAAGLTFYAGIAVVPVLVLSLALTSWLTSPARVRELTGRLAEVLPGQLGAPDALARLAEAGTSLSGLEAVLTLLPISLYGEGIRRALLRFSPAPDRFTAWRGRLLSLPLLLVAPLLLYPLLLVGRLLAELAAEPGIGATIGGFAAGYYSVLLALTVPLIWVFRVVAARPAAVDGRRRRGAVHRRVAVGLPAGVRAVPVPAAGPRRPLRWADRRRRGGRRRLLAVPAPPGAHRRLAVHRRVGRAAGPRPGGQLIGCSSISRSRCSATS